jgi:hypothetical protein
MNIFNNWPLSGSSGRARCCWMSISRSSRVLMSSQEPTTFAGGLHRPTGQLRLRY